MGQKRVVTRFAYWEACLILRSSIDAGCVFRLDNVEEDVSPEEDAAIQQAIDAVSEVIDGIIANLRARAGDTPPTPQNVIDAFK